MCNRARGRPHFNRPPTLPSPRSLAAQSFSELGEAGPQVTVAQFDAYLAANPGMFSDMSIPDEYAV